MTRAQKILALGALTVGVAAGSTAPALAEHRHQSSVPAGPESSVSTQDHRHETQEPQQVNRQGA